MSPLLFAVILGQATSGRPVHPGHKAVATNDAKPVTAREAREAFTRFSALYQKSSGFSAGAPGIPAADRPATRAEIVAEMSRFYKAAEPAFRFTPAAAKCNPAVFKIDAAQKAALTKLVVRGCVAPIGPLAVGPQAGLSPKQFGDALGFFMARLSQMSHLPSPKWTPMLQGD